MIRKETHRQEELERHYNHLYTNSIEKIKNGDYQLDDKLNDSGLDQRLGITLIARITGESKQNIQKFLLNVQNIEPDQYYYLNGDLHITIMPLITSHIGFDVNSVPVEDYVHLIKESVADIESFNIIFKGITASPSCIMIQGFLADDTLDQLRDKIRKTFRESKLKNTLDDRYPLITAHSTAIRFRQEIKDPSKLLDLLKTYEDTLFGTLEVKSLELTLNNWYHSISDTLYTFNLKDQ